MNLNINGFLSIIPMAFTAWIDVFAVLIVVIAVIALLNKMCK